MPAIEWQPRHRPTSRNTSPACSTFSLASSVKHYQAAPSTVTTPGRAPPPSPLYYDYTEDFDIDGYTRPQPPDPPFHFQIEKTILEDLPLSHGWRLKEIESVPEHTFSVTELPQSVVSSSPDIQGNSAEPQSSGSLGIVKTLDATREGDSHTANANNALAESPAQPPRDRRIIRLSGLGLGAQELNNHVEEAFGLVPSPSFEIFNPGQNVIGSAAELKATSISNELKFDEDNDTALQSVRASSYSFNTHLRLFPPPPLVPSATKNRDVSHRKSNVAIHGGETKSLDIKLSTTTPQRSELGQCQNGISLAPQSSAIINDGSWVSRSGTPGVGGFVNTEDLIVRVGTIVPSRASQEKTGYDDSKLFPPLSHKLSDESPGRKTVSSLRTKSFSSFSCLAENEKRKNVIPEEGTLWPGHRGGEGRVEALTLPRNGDSDTTTFSHQISQRFMSRSESPMLAPKPISPARQLKLKNSVPQLMKALPPLPPPEQTVQVVSPPRQPESPEAELRCPFAALITERRSPAGDKTSEARSRALGLRTDKKRLASPGSIVDPVELDSRFVGDVCHESRSSPPSHNSQPLPKLKLKSRNFAVLRPTFPPESRLWNLEENYPCSSQNMNVGQPPAIQFNKSSHSKPPKFKLKITRASTSMLGTIRINKDSSSDTKRSSGLHLRSPIDLFTRNSGIDGIFRQVSKHLHLRKESGHSNCAPMDEDTIQPFLDQMDRRAPSKQVLNRARAVTTSDPSSSLPDTRSSLSDDSSKLHIEYKLRKGLPVIESRINLPYSAGPRTGSQSYDDITWRDRNAANSLYPPGPLPTKSHQDLLSADTSGEVLHTTMLGKKVRAQKFRAKVLGWWKGARSVIAARVKSRNTTSSY